MTPTEILLLVASVLDSLGVPHAVVGSMASSAWGFPRSTNDADIVAELDSPHVPALVEALGLDFYVDTEAIERAIRTGRSFNAIHRLSAFKVDVFVPPPGGFGIQQIARRRLERVGPAPDGPLLAVAAPEDAILGKLEWFAKAGSVSDRQWRDVVGIMTVQRERLDVVYLRQWAARLGLLSLLERALTDAGLAGL
jgi:hypothetical protein